MRIFETEEIERLLQEYNPWWQSGAESEELPGGVDRRIMRPWRSCRAVTCGALRC